jgi:RNA polymerase sigma factor (TIGR02999 family)
LTADTQTLFGANGSQECGTDSARDAEGREHKLTRYLDELDEGREGAMERLVALVYDELRALAHRFLREEAATTLEPTALVHEVYLRFAGSSSAGCRNRLEFFRVAAAAMRRLLIDRARSRSAAKRGGGRRRLSLEELNGTAFERDAWLVALDDALDDLAAFDADLAKLIELRYFGGLTVEETARMLDVSPVTVKRRWRLAKGWLHRAMTGDAP